MKTRFAPACQLIALMLLVTLCLSSIAMAADKYRYVTLPPKPALPGTLTPAATLQEWNGTYTYNGTQYNYVMVGADPSTNQGALITTWIIPVKVVLSDGSVWDPLAGGPFSPLARTVNSPLFDRSTTYVQGGVNVGTTQYIDAYQRASFWSIVQNNPNYHILLGGPTSHVQVLPEVTYNIPSNQGHQAQHGGITVAEINLNYLDIQFANYMSQSGVVNPGGFPIFMTVNTYLDQGGCCVGGYHSANGSQTYSQFSYITTSGHFAQDVSALSHEIGEWAMDPLYPHTNRTPCGAMENGDPLENGETGHPFGDWEYTLNNFTYHLQDLVTLKYFGGDPNQPVNGYWTFQGFNGVTSVCQFGS